MDRNSTTSAYAALGLSGQMGCLMLIIALGALGVGLLLDHVFSSGHIWTLICVAVSVPLNLGFTLLVTQRLIKRIIPPDTVKTGKIYPGDEDN